MNRFLLERQKQSSSSDLSPSVLAIVLAVLLVACAQQPVTQPPLTPQAPMTPQQSDARTRAELHTQLGAGYFELRNYAVALEELNEALRADPNHSPAYNMLGLVYMALREDAAAEQNFTHALRLNPVDSDANNNYGWFLCQRQRYAEGIKYFLDAIKNPLYQTPDKSFVNAGLCARTSGDDAAAEQYFKRALSAQPVQPTALYQLADLAFKRNDIAAAKTYVTRLNQTGTTLGAEALWLALRIERRLGDRDAEASYGLQLRRNFPNSRETQALLNRQFE
ncbi:MAG: type IV pilus biogenesis/stability protein PilW [Burkholderiales bacterium]|nr:type IV pilus biogenesis/stability protein PilW [Burkholderiales bacterium]